MGDEIKGFLGEDWLRYQNELRAILASDIELLDSINQYILSNTGKQLRPMLCLLASRACGGSCLKAVPCAVAMELLHTATLIHDDVVDEADTPVEKPPSVPSTLQTMLCCSEITGWQKQLKCWWTTKTTAS